MIDKKTTHRKDITVWVEKSGISLDVTYDCTFTVTSSESQPGLVDRKVEWDNVTPIHVSYSDVNDDEIVWHYGDNMPAVIANALDRYEGIIDDKLNDKAQDNWL
jgi:hypothetical protein